MDRGGRRWALGASALTLAGLLAGALLLIGPTLDLPRGSASRPVGPGSFPLGILVLVIILSVLIGIQEVLRFLKPGPAPAPAPAPDAAGMRQVAYAGVTVTLLAVFIWVWQAAGFLVAAALFYAVLAVGLVPKERRSWRQYGLAAAIGITTTAGVWVLFQYVLGVPLR